MSNCDARHCEPESPLVSARGLWKSFRQGRSDYPVLRGIDLDVRGGEFVAIMGPSGSGKSTLLHVLGLMSRATRADRLTIDGVETTGVKASVRTALRRDKIGFVFQRFNLLPVLSAVDNLGIALRIRGEPVDHQVNSLLAFVGLSDRRDLKPAQMSIGEQQRLAFARAVIHHPRLLLADEPTGNLDSGNTARIMALMKQLRKEFHQTIILVTHNEHLSAEADRICLMKDGQLVDGTR